jgi:hypothetical protein
MSGAVISIMTGRHGWPDGPDYLMALRALRSLAVARYRLNRLQLGRLPPNAHFRQTLKWCWRSKLPMLTCWHAYRIGTASVPNLAWEWGRIEGRAQGGGI